MEREEIEPQMHLLRWIRCILNREFLLADAILLWDAIFSCVPNSSEPSGKQDPGREFLLLDFLCVAMLVFVRAFLL
jgi:TBC1 domain family protein 5